MTTNEEFCEGCVFAGEFEGERGSIGVVLVVRVD
jgi:hypothetical protein